MSKSLRTQTRNTNTHTHTHKHTHTHTHTHIHTRTHTRTHTHTHTYTHTHTQANTHKQTHTHTHTHTRAHTCKHTQHTHTRNHTRTRTRKHTRTCTCTHIHAQTHTHTHTRTNTHAHTYTHAHTNPRSPPFADTLTCHGSNSRAVLVCGVTSSTPHQLPKCTPRFSSQLSTCGLHTSSNANNAVNNSSMHSVRCRLSLPTQSCSWCSAQSVCTTHGVLLQTGSPCFCSLDSASLAFANDCLFLVKSVDYTCTSSAAYHLCKQSVKEHLVLSP